MAAGENADNWLETKLERYYPEPQPEAIEELVEAVTSEHAPAGEAWFENPFSLEDLLIFDDETLRDLLASDTPGLGLDDLARSLHDAPAPLVERVTRALPKRERARFQALRQQPAPPQAVKVARRRLLDHLFWELTYWKTPDLYEELTEGERLHPDLFRQLRPDLRDNIVLDAGAGSGRATFECLRQGARLVYAVEPSPGLLRLLKNKLARSGVRQIIPLRGRFDALPLDDQSVDTALSCSAFTAEEGQGGEAGLAELKRVTRRGGKIILIWPRPEDYHWLAAHGFQYVALPMPEEPRVRYRSWRSAWRVARRFHARNRALARHLLRSREPEVPYSLLGPNPPHDYCWLAV
ncbi:MAG TPA: methyltransferase domain-containing protein [Ktedonobacterales bacterium]|nr:methyltransferase domain-containing protein [Ktedonobacterales bacterium]